MAIFSLISTIVRAVRCLQHITTRKDRRNRLGLDCPLVQLACFSSNRPVAPAIKDAQIFGDGHKLRQRRPLELAHDIVTVGFDRALGRAELVRDLLFEFPADDETEDFAFAAGEMSRGLPLLVYS